MRSFRTTLSLWRKGAPFFVALLLTVFQAAVTFAAPPAEVRLEPIGDISEHDLFGDSVAIGGNTLVIGANGTDGSTIPDEGAAFVFQRSDDSWIQTARLLPSDARTQDEFGVNVGISADGTTIIVAADQQTVNVNHQGVVYVFQLVNGAWAQQAELTSPTPANGGGFGFFGIAIDGNSIAVGDAGGPLNGFTPVVDVFTRTGSGWQLSSVITVPDNFAFFPQSVSMSGNLLVVSSTDSFVSSGGAAYVFSFANGAWVRQATLVPDDPQFGAGFGTSVSVHGNVIAVGAPFATGATFFSGESYVYAKGTQGWTEQQKLVASDANGGDLFGQAVSVDGGTVAIGALGHITPVGVQAGSVYIYQRGTGNAWTLSSELAAGDGVDGGGFGGAVALFGNTLVAGAAGQHPQVDTGTGYPGGEAYVDPVNN